MSNPLDGLGAWLKDKLNIAVFTAVEDIALIAWLAVVRAELQVIGLGILFVGLLFEHLFSYNVIRNFRLGTTVAEAPVRRNIVGFSLIETGIWGVWLLLAGINPALAFVFLLAGLIIEHTLTDNVMKGHNLFFRIVDLRVLPFSIVETVGATAWLRFVDHGMAIEGIVVLVVLQFIEHMMATALSRRA